MAAGGGGRLKAIASDSGGGEDGGRGDGGGGAHLSRVVEIEEVEEEETEQLELGLTLGGWGWGEDPAFDAGRGFVRPVFTMRGSEAGSSSLHVGPALERQPPPRLLPQLPVFRLREVPRSGMRVDEDLIGAERIADEAYADREDLQNKRPKVYDYGEASPHHATTSFFGFELSPSPAPDEYDDTSNLSRLFKNESAQCLALFPHDGADGVPNEPTNEGDIDVENPGARSVEEVVTRMDLSDDLLHLIFSFLGQKDLCRAGASCKQWHAASTHEDFWRCLRFENTQISLQNFVVICQRYQNIRELDMFGVLHAEALVMEAIPFLRRLEALTMGKGMLGDTFFQALVECPLLTTLTLCDASLGSGNQEITVNHDGLRELQIVKCRALRISVRCSQLRTLSLKRTSMAHVSLNCPQLHQLDFSSCHKLSDSAIRQAATACPLLASLDMSSCSCVTDETLRDIASSCPNLSILDASNCPNISFESVRLPMLIDLKLRSCEGITSASMAAISYSRMLEALLLDDCCLLTSVSLDLPRLRNISLVHLRKFVDLNLRSPLLSSIKVSRCSALNRISITSNFLQKLVLQKQESLASLSLQCPNLIDVDLSDCESLTKAICEVLSDGGGCPMLKSLVLDNCDSLKMVELNSSSLVSLSLAGCRCMTLLKLSCPNLENVNLDGCDHLENASFSPVGLEILNLGICPKLSVLRIEAPYISMLELKGCGVLSRASINCPRLISLDASFCRELVDESLSTTAASCPLLEYLVLSYCELIGRSDLSSLKCLQRLTLLDLSYTELIDLDPVFKTCLQLKILKLMACKCLSDSSLDALYIKGALPTLVELDLSYSSIGQHAIAGVLSYCTNLVNVNLNGCTNLVELVCSSTNNNSTEMLVDVCPSNSTPDKNDEGTTIADHLLEVLNCTGCPNVKKVLIPSMAYCRRLSILNLNLSANLKEVDLTCYNLCTLNLSNCSSLEVLKLECPRLTNLQLLACSMLQEEELESAIARCSVLEILNVHSCPKINALDFGRLRMVCPSLKHIQSSLIA